MQKQTLTKGVKGSQQPSSTIEKLQSLKPLRDQQKGNTVLYKQHRTRTPLGSNRNEKETANIYKRTSNIGQKSSKKQNPTAAGSNFDQTVSLEFYNSIDSRQTSTTNFHQQYSSRQMVDGSSNMIVATRPQQRDKSQTLLMDQPLNLYVIKNKRSKGQAKQMAQQPQLTHNASQKSLNSNKPKQAQSQMAQSQYATVKSKVRTNLRSKTPKRPAQQSQRGLSKKQVLDQKEKLTKRSDDIVKLENEVHRLHNDWQFRLTNKNQILSTYDNESTDESSKRSKLTEVQSKRQFSDFEKMLFQIEKMNEQDRVYLEICGIADWKEGKTLMIEAQNTKDKQQSCSLSSSSYPLNSTKTANGDITGSVTFFEQRNTFRTTQVINLEEVEADQSPTQIKRIDYNEDEENDMGLDFTADEDVRRKRQELRAINQQLVEDFDHILQEMLEQRKTHSHMAFYEALNEFNYDKKQLDSAHYRDEEGVLQLAQSPTKRLICMKNQQMEHIKQIKDRNLLHTRSMNQQQHEQLQQVAASRVYMASPERSYVVKVDKQIDYNLAFKKDPSRFYEEALNAPITKHKIQQQRQSVSPRDNGNMNERKQSTLGSVATQSIASSSVKNFQKTTMSSNMKRKRDHETYTIVSKTNVSRPHNKINSKIKQRIEQKLADKLGDELTQEVLKALEEANLHEAINDLIGERQRSTEGKHLHKAMSVKSLPIQKFEVDYNQQQECESVQKAPVFQQKQRQSSNLNYYQHPIVSNQATVGKEMNPPLSQRSAYSSCRQFENLEEDVKINRAY